MGYWFATLGILGWVATFTAGILFEKDWPIEAGVLAAIGCVMLAVAVSAP
jgi:hypothetical protein